MERETMPGARCWAVVVAAGRGARFGKPYNKVFFPLEGRSILSRCLDALSAPGLYSLKYFTVDSNLLMGIAAFFD